MIYTILFGNPEKRPFGILIINVGIILEWILRKWSVSLWSGCNLDKMGSGDGCSEHGNDYSVSIIGREFLGDLNDYQILNTYVSQVVLAKLSNQFGTQTHKKLLYLLGFSLLYWSHFHLNRREVLTYCRE
jgi:hypothetical protein